MTTQVTWRIPSFGIGDRLRKAREDAGYTDQSEFAELLGISRDTVRNYERGKTGRLSRPILMSWSLATGVPVEWLKDGLVPGSGPDGGSTKAVLSYRASRSRSVTKRRATTGAYAGRTPVLASAA